MAIPLQTPPRIPSAPPPGNQGPPTQTIVISSGIVQSKATLVKENYNVNYKRELYRPNRTVPVQPLSTNISFTLESDGSTILISSFIISTAFNIKETIDNLDLESAEEILTRFLSILDYLFGRAFRTSAYYKTLKRESTGNKILLIYKLDTFNNNHQACMVECTNITIKDELKFSCNYKLYFRNYSASDSDIQLLFVTDNNEVRTDVSFVKFPYGDDTYRFPSLSTNLSTSVVDLCDYGETHLPVYADNTANIQDYITMLQRKYAAGTDTYYHVNNLLNETKSISLGSKLVRAHSLALASKYRDEIIALNAKAQARTDAYNSEDSFTLQIGSAIETYQTRMKDVAQLLQHGRTTIDDFRNILIYNNRSYLVGASDSLILNLSTFEESNVSVTDENLPGTDSTDEAGVMTLGTSKITVLGFSSGTSITLLSEIVPVITPEVNINDAYLLNKIRHEAKMLSILYPNEDHESTFNRAYEKVLTKIFDTDTYEITYTPKNVYKLTISQLKTGTDSTALSTQITIGTDRGITIGSTNLWRTLSNESNSPYYSNSGVNIVYLRIGRLVETDNDKTQSRPGSEYSPYMIQASYPITGLLSILSINAPATSGSVINDIYVKVTTANSNINMTAPALQARIIVELPETQEVSTSQAKIYDTLLRISTSSATHERIERKYYQQYVLFPAVDRELLSRRGKLQHNIRTTLNEEELTRMMYKVMQQQYDAGNLPEMFNADIKILENIDAEYEPAETSELDENKAEKVKAAAIEAAKELYRVYSTYYKDPDMRRPDTDDNDLQTVRRPTIKLGSSYLAYDSVYDNVFNGDDVLVTSSFAPDGGWSIYENYFNVYNQQYLTDTIQVPDDELPE